MKQIIISILVIISIFDFKNLSSMRLQDPPLDVLTFKRKTIYFPDIFGKQTPYEDRWQITLESEDESNFCVAIKAPLFYQEFAIPKEVFEETRQTLRDLSYDKFERIIYLYQLKQIWKTIKKAHWEPTRYPSDHFFNFLRIKWHKKAIKYLTEKVIRNTCPRTRFSHLEIAMLYFVENSINAFRLSKHVATKVASICSQFLNAPKRRELYRNKKEILGLKPPKCPNSRKTISENLTFCIQQFYGAFQITSALGQYQFSIHSFLGPEIIGSIPFSSAIETNYADFISQPYEERIICLHQQQKVWRKIRIHYLRNFRNCTFELRQIRWHKKALKYLIDKTTNEPTFELSRLEKIMLFVVFANSEAF